MRGPLTSASAAYLVWHTQNKVSVVMPAALVGTVILTLRGRVSLASHALTH